MEPQSSRAFYMSRVDDEGIDMKIRPSSSLCEMQLMSSARTFEMPMMSTRSSAVSSKASSRSIHYINPACFIEKDADDTQSQSGHSILSTTVSEPMSDIVPPLDLQSECFPTRREGYTFSYRHNGEPSKLKENPSLAYENWLSAKRKILSDKAAKRRQEEEARQREKEERKRLAAEKYQKWLETKQQQKLKQKNKQNTLRQRQREPADERKIQEKIEEWERNKRLEIEHRREMRRLQKEKRENEDRQRHQLAQAAWDKWILEAPSKPKPVPLNRGLFTLRGTISDIFVNPNEWKSGDAL